MLRPASGVTLTSLDRVLPCASSFPQAWVQCQGHQLRANGQRDSGRQLDDPELDHLLGSAGPGEGVAQGLPGWARLCRVWRRRVQGGRAGQGQVDTSQRQRMTVSCRCKLVLLPHPDLTPLLPQRRPFSMNATMSLHAPCSATNRACSGLASVPALQILRRGSAVPFPSCSTSGSSPHRALNGPTRTLVQARAAQKAVPAAAAAVASAAISPEMLSTPVAVLTAYHMAAFAAVRRHLVLRMCLLDGELPAHGRA